MNFKGFSVGIQNDSEKIKQLVLQSKQIADDLASLQAQIQELSTSKTSGSGGLPVVGEDNAAYSLDLVNCTSLCPLVIDKNKRKIQSIESVPNATKWGGYAPAVITTTFPTVGNFVDVALPSGWTADNTVILGGQVRESASTFRYSLNYTYDTYGLYARILFYGSTHYLRLNNKWNTTYMNGQVCRVFIAKIF